MKLSLVLLRKNDPEMSRVIVLGSRTVHVHGPQNCYLTWTETTLPLSLVPRLSISAPRVGSASCERNVCLGGILLQHLIKH